MNRAQKFGFAMMALSIVLPIVLDEISFRHMTKKPKQEDVELQKEIAADRYAKGIVHSKIYGQGYGDSLIDPSEDFEFYRIAYHLKHN